MLGIRTEAEQLPNGMEAVFVHQPHWQTNAARLIVHAGTLHEDESTPTGVAHFFEHLAFQGTADFADLDALEEYREANFASMNAMTGMVDTTYMANSPTLDSALKIVTQLALAPTMGADTIEKERGAIIDEARSHQFDLAKQANRRQLAALGGAKYGEIGTGTIEQVAAITHEDIVAFRNRHYRAANMLLIVCGSEPIGVQRDKAIEFIDDFANTEPGEPYYWNLPWLKPGQLISAVQTTLPPESQTHLSVNYGIPPTPDIQENLTFNIAGSVLGANANQRLRRELVAAYGANGCTYYLENRNFSAHERYGATYTSTSTNGTEAHLCLDELLNTVPAMAARDEKRIQQAIDGVRFALRAELEYTPSAIADNIPGNVLFRRKRVIDPVALSEVASKILVQDVQEAIQEFMMKPDLIQITSPNEDVLAQAETQYA